MANARTRVAVAMNIDQRRKEVSKLYAQRLSQWEIAERLGVTQSTISDDIAAMRAHWKAEQQRDINEVISRELSDIECLEEIAAGVALDERMPQTIRMAAMDRVKMFKEMRARYLSLFAPVKAEILTVNADDVRAKIIERLTQLRANRELAEPVGEPDGS